MARRLPLMEKGLWVSSREIDTMYKKATVIKSRSTKRDAKTSQQRGDLRMWVSWWNKVFARTLALLLPAPIFLVQRYLEVVARLRLYPLHFSWICTCPTSPKEQKGVAVWLGVAHPNTKHLLCQGWGFVQQCPLSSAPRFGPRPFKGVVHYFANPLSTLELDLERKKKKKQNDTTFIFPSKLWSFSQ